MLYNFVRFLCNPILNLLFKPQIIGLENFPTSGKTIVYSNHICALDPVVLACILPRKINFMAKSELFQNRILAYVLRRLGAFPVRRGTADISAIKNSLRVLNEGGVFGIFPEGTRSKDGKLKTFSQGVASIAHKSKATLVPVVFLNDYKVFGRLRIRIGAPLDFKSYFEQRSNTELFEIMTDEMGQAIKKMLG